MHKFLAVRIWNRLPRNVVNFLLVGVFKSILNVFLKDVLVQLQVIGLDTGIAG